MNDFLTKPPFIPAWARNYKDNVFFIYNGISMLPLFNPGDLLCIQKSALGKIHLGDVVIVDWGCDKKQSEYVVHRVVSMKHDCLITQGDNNLIPDAQPVSTGNFVGLVTSFNRSNRVYVVTGGFMGLFYARFILIRNYIWLFVKKLGWRAYGHLRQSGLAAKLWRPVIGQLRLITDNGLLIKYYNGKRTVAYWWPETKNFDVIKPFDLVIPNPDESK